MPDIEPEFIYMAYSTEEHDERGPLWWSNDDGWTDQAHATRFTEEEVHDLHLPLGGRWAEVAVPEPPPPAPAWFQRLLDERGMTVSVDGTYRGSVIYSCTGDCCCWFLLSDEGETKIIDRFAYVNEDGWCQGQDCPCHSLPHTVEA